MVLYWKREILITNYSAQENVATERPEIFCAWILPIPNAHESSKPDSSNIAKKLWSTLSVAFVGNKVIVIADQACC